MAAGGVEPGAAAGRAGDGDPPVDRDAAEAGGAAAAGAAVQTVEPDGKQPESLKGFVLGLIAVVIAVGALSMLVVRPYVAEPFYIPSASMEPTLHGCDGCTPDRVLVDKLSYRFRDPQRGEVVVFERPAGLTTPEDRLIKRVVGLPGETVSGRDGSVWIGERRLDEPYVNPACNGTTDFAPMTVPAGTVLVLGDNRCNSLDGRVFGPIAQNSIVGRAFLIIWPLGRLHWL
jgi:signal peptidase I